MEVTMRAWGIACRMQLSLAMVLCALVGRGTAQETEDSAPTEGQAVLQRATEHMQELSMRLADGNDAIEWCDRPLLTYGDAARANKNGTLWASSKSGRPLAILELYQGLEPDARWVHAVTLTSSKLVQMKTPTGAVWSPETSHVEPALVPDAASPADREPVRLTQ